MTQTVQKYVDKVLKATYNRRIRYKKGDGRLSEKEKDLIKKLSDTVPRLDKEKQNYLLGVAEGMAIAKECSDTEEKESIICS